MLFARPVEVSNFYIYVHQYSQWLAASATGIFYNYFWFNWIKYFLCFGVLQLTTEQNTPIVSAIMIFWISMSKQKTLYWPGISSLPTLQPESLLSTVSTGDKKEVTKHSHHYSQIHCLLQFWSGSPLFWQTTGPTLYTEGRNCSKSLWALRVKEGGRCSAQD